jgi:hypothetical protein
MTRRRTLGLTAIIVAVVAVPTAIVVAGNGNFVTDTVNEQTTVWTGKHKAPADWTIVPDVGSLNVANDGHAVILSAEMARGRAKFRVQDNGLTLAPGAAVFVAKGANSFSWAYLDGCMPGPDPVLQWKRAGKGKAIASRLSTVNLHSGALCL